MKKLVILLLCAFIACGIAVPAAATDFIKISGGLGLKDDGTLWKLPFEYDNMLYQLERKGPKQYRTEGPKPVTHIPGLAEGHIINFEGKTKYTCIPSETNTMPSFYCLNNLIYMLDNGKTHGYSVSIGTALANVRDDLQFTLDNIAQLCPANTDIAITTDRKIYMDSVLNRVEDLDDIIIADVRYNIEVYGKSFAVNSNGEVYQWGSLPLGTRYKKIDKLTDIQDIKATKSGITYCLDRQGNSFISIINSFHDSGPLQKLDISNSVKSIHSYEVYHTLSQNRAETNLGAENVIYKTFDHYAALKEDGTVWHFGYMADKNRHKIDENLTAEKNVIMKPVQIKGIDGVKQIDVLDENIFMLKEDGSIVLWGLDALENLHTDTPTPLETRNFYVYMDTASDTIEVNGHKSELDEGRGTKPVVMDGTVMVPVRNVVEKLGGQIGWEEQSQRVTIQLWDKEFKFQAGSDQILENGQYHALSKPSIVLDDRTMVPVDFFEKNLGCTLETQQQENSITVKFVYNEIL